MTGVFLLAFGLSTSTFFIKKKTQLDIYSWALIELTEIAKAAKEHQDQDRMLLQGHLDQVLPDFQNQEAIAVQICLPAFVSDEILVTEINSNGKLKDAFNNGLNMLELINLLENTIHA